MKHPAEGDALSSFRGPPSHVFGPDDIRLRDAQRFDATRLLTSTQVIDSDLLALAHKHHRRLASVDRRLVTNAARVGSTSLLPIE